MSNEIQIRIDAEEVKKKLAVLEGIKDGVPTVAMRALNGTLTHMKKRAPEQIAARYTVEDAESVKSRLSLKKATMSDLSIAMSSKGRPMALNQFTTKVNTNPGMKGDPTVHARVKQGGGGFTGGFIATMKSGHTGVYRRTGQLTNARTIIRSISRKNMSRYARRTVTNKGREGIKQLYGPGVVQMLSEHQVQTNLQQSATEYFNKTLDRRIKRLLKQQEG